eukprot:721640-Prymnesium_polylepis.2
MNAWTFDVIGGDSCRSKAAPAVIGLAAYARRGHPRRGEQCNRVVQAVRASSSRVSFLLRGVCRRDCTAQQVDDVRFAAAACARDEAVAPRERFAKCHGLLHFQAMVGSHRLEERPLPHIAALCL